ncbi:MAG TPA: substrate-binding domain-containing protein, partial [Flavisolibacter sp.]|nr:substrate-binding domain-containing protein [Flavisolibacter sp.]
FFDRVTDEIETHKVIVNNYAGAFKATEHLISQGYKNIAHITSSPYLSITRERLDGFKAALQKHNQPFQENLVKYCSRGGMIAQEAENAIEELFNGKVKPDAIFTAGDRLTIECFGFLKRLKQKKEVGFIGFSNSLVGDLFAPSLSVIRQPAFDIGQAAIELLIQIIESKRPVTEFQHKVMETELIVRESSQVNAK